MATTIGISGSYGGLNVGDEAILTCALAELRAHVPDVQVVVFSRDPRHTGAHYDVVAAVQRELRAQGASLRPGLGE